MSGLGNAIAQKLPDSVRHEPSKLVSHSLGRQTRETLEINMDDHPLTPSHPTNLVWWWGVRVSDWFVSKDALRWTQCS